MRRYYYILLLLILPYDLTSQIVYEITKYNSDKVSYLVGSHHYLSVSSLNNKTEVFKAFNDSEAVIGEVLINEDSITSYSKYLFSDKSIFSICSEDELKVIDSLCNKRLNVSLEQLQLLKPAMISNMLLQALLDEYYPDSEDSMMDSFFQKVAVQQSKDVYGLELIEEQMKLLFNLKRVERQAQELNNMVADYDNFLSEIKKIDSLYSVGNLMPLYVEYQNDSTMKEGEKFLMLDARNLNWINKIDELISTKKCFVIVGALHLYGENGLINLLKKRGYKVKPK